MRFGKSPAILLLASSLQFLAGCVSFESDVFVHKATPLPARPEPATIVQTDVTLLAADQSNPERISSK